MESNELFSLKGKVIVVTGGTGILGGAFVKGIAAAGGTAVILGRNAAVAEQRAQEDMSQRLTSKKSSSLQNLRCHSLI